MVFSLPRSCPGCGAVGVSICADCRAALNPAGSLPPPPGVDALVALFWFGGVGASMIKALKYTNHRDALGPLTLALGAEICWQPDVVTWIPTTRRRRMERGYDQAELLAQSVARYIGVRARPLLVRVDGGSQTRRSRVDRLNSAGFAAQAVSPATVLIVDDVVTTGASLSSAALALRRSGATEIGAAVLAANSGVRPLRSL